MFKQVVTHTFILIFLLSLYAAPLLETSHSNLFSGEHTQSIKKELGPDITLKSRGAQYFPLSSYPMYSEAFDPGNLTFVELRGISENGEELYIHGRHYFHPLWRRRAMLENYLAFLSTGKSADQYLKVLWKEYKRKKENSSWGYDNEPQLKSMQLSIVNWEFSDWLEHKKNNPSIKKLYDWKGRKHRPNKILKIATIYD